MGKAAKGNELNLTSKYVNVRKVKSQKIGLRKLSEAEIDGLKPNCYPKVTFSF